MAPFFYPFSCLFHSPFPHSTCGVVWVWSATPIQTLSWCRWALRRCWSHQRLNSLRFVIWWHRWEWLWEPGWKVNRWQHALKGVHLLHDASPRCGAAGRWADPHRRLPAMMLCLPSTRSWPGTERKLGTEINFLCFKWISPRHFVPPNSSARSWVAFPHALHVGSSLVGCRENTSWRSWRCISKDTSWGRELSYFSFIKSDMVLY